MKVSFYVYCRAPLGKLLGAIVETCGRVSGSAPKKLLLTSRQSREDLPRGEILRSAATSGSDSCDIVMDVGEIGMAWLYGPRRDVPRMWGTLKVSGQDLSQLRALLNELCVVTRATYAVGDQETIRTASLLANEVDKYESEGLVSALHALHWWNYFGPEYREELPVTDGVRAAAAEVEEVEGGGLAVITRRSPKDPVDSQGVAALADEWPVFRKYNAKAGFKTPIRIDYSQVWDLPAPVSKEGPVRDVVGPPDKFIASVPTHARRFIEWTQSKGLSPKTEEDFLQVLQEHDAVIRDELLVPAIAAYGELVKARMDGAWKKSILHRGEPVVVKPGKPWTARRVILEVLEGMEPVEL